MTNMFGKGGARRANRRDFDFDESKLRPKQREAAVLLIEKEFADKGERKTNDQIAEELGITRMTLYNWDTRDRNFIEYKNFLAADFFDSYLPFVYKKLIDGIHHGSMKGIEIFLKRRGELDSRSEVTVTAALDDDMTYEERKAELLDRIRQTQQETDSESVEDDA